MPSLHTRFPLSLWIALLAVIGTLCHGHMQEHTTDANTIQTPISIVLPPHNFANIYTSEIACNNVSLSDLTSSLPSPTSLTFSAFGIQVLCQASWTNSIDNVNGTLQALVANSNVSLGLALLMGSSGLVSGVNATQCEAGAQVANVEVEGGSMDNNTKLAISAYIAYSFQRAMCDSFADSIANLTTYIEQENDNIFNWISPPVLPPPDTDTSTFVKFTDNAFLGAIEYVTDTLVGANGPLGLNKLVNLATNNTGTLIIPNVTEFLPKIHLAVPPYYTMPLQGYGTATLGVYSMNLTGLNSWSDVELFHPYDNFTLDFIAALADVELSAHLYVNITAENGVEGPSVYDEVILKVNFSQIEFRTVVFAGLESAILQNLSANQLTSPGCLLPAINQIAFRLFELSINVSGVEVLPLASSSSTQVDWLVFNLATLAVPSFLPVIAPLLNSFLDTTGIELATYGIELALQYLHLPCAPKQAINTHTFNQASTIYALGGAAGLFFIIGAVAFFIKYRRSKRDPYLDERAPLYGESASPRVNDAIILTDEVPVLVRYGIVALILANIALFVSSNTSIGASVYLVIKANGLDAINFPSLFDFSLGNSVRDMWNAGVYPLSILIAVFSGIWPYVKLVLLLACWVIPFGKISVVHRERTLLLLDALGKCSLIDSFVMILMMVAFHFSISPPVTPYTPEGSLIVQTWVQPHYGFYAFICATILSLITTHIIVSYHRRATNEVERINNDDKKSLLAYSRKSGSLAFVISVLVLSLVATALVAVGLSIISFDFEFRGAFGYLLTLIDQPTTTSYSVFSLGSGIPSSSANPHYAGIVLLQISFFIFICVTPLSYLVLLILLWVWPLTYQAQRRLLHVTEVVQAWASLEVFVVAVIAALVELQQFAQFILGNRCDQINPYLEKYFGPMLDGDDKCFDVAAYLKTGCWVTFSACILYLVIGVFVIHRCHKALRYRLEDIQQNAING